MHFVKNLTSWIFIYTYRLSLGLLIVSGPLLMVLGTTEPLKKALNTSNIYEIVSTESAIKSVEEGQNINPAQDNTALIQATKSAISPQFMRDSTEKVIDGIYGWLNGKTQQPEFIIDTTEAKQRLASSLGDYAVAKAQQLPVCTVKQARALLGSSVDPFNLPCIPPNYDVNNLRAEVAKQIQNSSSDIFKDSKITPENLPKDEKGRNPIQNLTTQAKDAPKAFRLLQLSPYIFTILAIMSGGAYVWLQNNHKKALGRLATTTAGLGIISLMGVLITVFVVSKLSDPNNPLTQKLSGPYQKQITDVMKELITSINNKVFVFAMVYVIVGAGVLLAIRLNRPKSVTPPGPKPEDQIKADSPTT